MKARIYSIIWLTCIFCTTVTNSQELPQSIKSPNAANLGKFGDLPVSYSTGAVDVSIPLHELSSNGINLPITLRYDASGVRVNSLPSWVGQNWTLDAGGVITRTTQGYPDEYKYISSAYIKFSNYFSSYSHLADIYGNNERLRESVSYKDFDPDIFNFTFMGKSGKFFLGNDGEWKILSEHNIDVIFDINNQDNFANQVIEDIPNTDKKSKTIYGFRLRDDEGTTYEFGYNKNAIEYSIDFFNQYYGIARPVWTANSWYLTKVTDKYNNLIYELSYIRGYFIAHLYNTYQYMASDHQQKRWGSERFNDHTTAPYFSGDLISPVYLREIKDHRGDNCVTIISKDSEEKLYSDHYREIHALLSNDGVNYQPWFYYYLQSNDPQLKYLVYNWDDASLRGFEPLLGLRMRKLNYVSIRHGQIYKVYEFEHNNESEERLNLKALHIYNDAFYYSKPNGLLASYTFDYNNFSGIPTDYLSKKTDHWGYYNNSTYSFPRDEDGYNSFFQTRNTNSNYVKYGMLTSITYPTGGKTFFEYEPHSYSKIVSLDRQSMEDEVCNTVGGVRIKSITDYDNNQVIKKRNFYYTIPKTNISSGQLSSRPLYYWNRWETSPIGPNTSGYLRIFRTSSIIPLSNSFGSHISYSYVKEEITGEGYVQYKYSNFSDAPDAPSIKSLDSGAPSPYYRFCERGYKRGKLLETSFYDNNNQQLRKIRYNYRTDNVEGKYVLSTNIKTVLNSTSAAFTYYSGNVYKIFYPKYDLASITETDYYGTDSISKTTSYTRKDIELSLTSNGYFRKANIRATTKQSVATRIDIYSTFYKYPFDLTETTYMSDITQRFDIAYPVEVYTERLSTNTGYRRTTYKKLSGSSLIVPDKLFSSERGESELREKTSFIAYKSDGRLESYKTIGKPQQTIVWGYDKTKPLVVVDNFGYGSGSPINSGIGSSLLNSDNPDRDELVTKYNSLQRQIPSARITGYTYTTQFGEISSISASNGITTYYDYDKIGRLTEVYYMDNNVKHTISTHTYHYRSGASDQNYVLTRNMTNSDASTYQDVFEYIDGLGRPLQTIEKGVTPQGADLVYLREYDARGRESTSWLPAVVAGNNGKFVPKGTFITKSQATYSSDGYSYSKKVYEKSPLNRVLQEYGPGQEWHVNKKAVTTGYLTNKSKTGTTLSLADSLICRLYVFSTANNNIDIRVYRVPQGYYDANTLQVTRTKDEDGNTGYVFTDMFGQTLLTRKISNGKLYDTNYVYDECNNLRVVLPPEASDK